MAVHKPGDGSSVPLDGKHMEIISEVHFGLSVIGVYAMLTIPLVHRTRMPPVVCSVGRRNVTMATIQAPTTLGLGHSPNNAIVFILLVELLHYVNFTP